MSCLFCCNCMPDGGKPTVTAPPPQVVRPPTSRTTVPRRQQTFKDKETQLLQEKGSWKRGGSSRRKKRSLSLKKLNRASLQAVQGHMEKEGHFVRNWKKRMFFVKARTGLLEYYDDRTTPWTKRGTIELNDKAHIAEKKNADLTLICGTGKVYQLRCDSEEAKRRWFAALRKIIQGSRDPNDVFDAFHSDEHLGDETGISSSGASSHEDEWTRERSDDLFESLDGARKDVLTVFELQRQIDVLKAHIDPKLTTRALKDAYSARTLDKSDFFYLILKLTHDADGRTTTKEEERKSTSELDDDLLGGSDSSSKYNGLSPASSWNQQTAAKDADLSGHSRRPPQKKSIHDDFRDSGLDTNPSFHNNITTANSSSSENLHHVQSGDINDWRLRMSTYSASGFSEKDFR